MRNWNIKIIALALAGLVSGTPPALGFDCGDYPPPPYSNYYNMIETEAVTTADVEITPEAEQQQVGGISPGNESKEL